MATPFNRTDVNSKIYRKCAFDDSYKKTLNKHVLNNLTENTKLTVYNTYIKIKTNKNITDFFKVLENEENIFICDFNNKDYFWLSKVNAKNLV